MFYYSVDFKDTKELVYLFLLNLLRCISVSKIGAQRIKNITGV